MVIVIYTAFRVLKAYKKKQAVNLKIIKYLTKFGIYRSLAVGIATTVISIIMNLMGITVGSIVATVAKRYFVSYKKQAKQFVYFGRTISVTYINFGNRR